VAIDSRLSNKPVYRNLQEMIKPAHTSLLIIDMQEEYCGQGRRELGLDPTPQHVAAKVIGRLVVAARHVGVLPVFIKNDISARGYTHSGVAIANEIHVFGRYGVSTEDTPGSEFLLEIGFKPDDIVVRKNRNSSFHATNLDLVLRSNGVQTVVITGQATFACVDTTARDALCHDYYVVVVEDAVATVAEELEYHTASLSVLRHFLPVCGVASSDQLLALWGVTS